MADIKHFTFDGKELKVKQAEFALDVESGSALANLLNQKATLPEKRTGESDYPEFLLGADAWLVDLESGKEVVIKSSTYKFDTKTYQDHLIPLISSGENIIFSRPTIGGPIEIKSLGGGESGGVSKAYVDAKDALLQGQIDDLDLNVSGSEAKITALESGKVNKPNFTANFPYSFEITGGIDAYGVKTYTYDLVTGAKLTFTYDNLLVGTTASKAGLMSKADKVALDKVISDLVVEVNARQSGDAQEKFLRESGDNALNLKILEEELRAKSAESGLQTNINNEKLLRETKDTELEALAKNLFNLESGERISADDEIRNRFSNYYESGIVDAKINAKADDFEINTDTLEWESGATLRKLKAKIPGVLIFKDSKDYVSEVLAITGAARGDTYYARYDDRESGAPIEVNALIVWNGSNWVYGGSTATNLALYAQLSYTEATYVKKSLYNAEMAAERLARESGINRLDAKIDAKITEVKGKESGSEAKITALESGFESEIEDRTNADNALGERINDVILDLASESGRAKLAESALNTKIDNEKDRALLAESGLRSQMSTFTADLLDEQSARIAGNQSLESGLRAEIIRATTAEFGKQDKLVSQVNIAALTSETNEVPVSLLSNKLIRIVIDGGNLEDEESGFKNIIFTGRLRGCNIDGAKDPTQSIEKTYLTSETSTFIVYPDIAAKIPLPESGELTDTNKFRCYLVDGDGVETDLVKDTDFTYELKEDTSLNVTYAIFKLTAIGITKAKGVDIKEEHLYVSTAKWITPSVTFCTTNPAVSMIIANPITENEYEFTVIPESGFKVDEPNMKFVGNCTHSYDASTKKVSLTNIQSSIDIKIDCIPE